MLPTHSRVLIVVSYNGNRHRTNLNPTQMLEIQASQLASLKHHLDKIVIVVPTDAPIRVDDRYETALSKFSDVLRVPNGDQGSYGAWRDAFLMFPNFEWYFFIEDDYTFFLDDFDQLMIDMWTPETTYLAHHMEEDSITHGKHASMSSGLVRGESIQKVDWTFFNSVEGGEYNSKIQVIWSSLFNNDGLRDITSKYSAPFWTGSSIIRIDEGKPILIGPMQLIHGIA